MGWKLKDLFWISPDERAEPEDDGIRAAESAAAPAGGGRAPSASGGQDVQGVLSILRDVDGVIGSIVARVDGTVIGYDLPRTFDDAAVEGAARQMSLLRTALVREGGGLKVGTFRFRDFHFHVDEVPSGLIGILAAERTDRPTLRMAVKLLARRIGENRTA